MKYKHYNNTRGFTLVEILVCIFIFTLISLSVYRSIASIYQVHETTDAKVVATQLAGEQIEIIRNFPYSSVGIKSGLPVGVIDHIQSISRSGFNFEVTTTVRNIDDPFDGVFPTDTVPADYKLVQMDIDCLNCKNFSQLTFTTTVGPKALETPSTSGALFIQAIDASGLPVSQADVHIVNSSISPAITIDDTTNNSGLLQIVSAPPGTNAYKVTVSKDGYSTETTYAPGTSGNANPTKPNPTVIQQQVTQLSFAIDKLSTINVSTVDNMCTVIPSIPFTISGAKIIGTPNVLKYSKSTSTNAGGILALSNIEWDTYNATETSSTYDFAGSIPVLPLSLTPDSIQDLKLILVTSTSSSAELVTVLDSATNLPVSGATVTLTGATTTSLTTGRGFINQTSWTGGGGHA
jgi:prepilin-type N-terminal cleavage/methylation domain-containing protein